MHTRPQKYQIPRTTQRFKQVLIGVCDMRIPARNGGSRVQREPERFPLLYSWRPGFTFVFQVVAPLCLSAWVCGQETRPHINNKPFPGNSYCLSKSNSGFNVGVSVGFFALFLSEGVSVVDGLVRLCSSRLACTPCREPRWRTHLNISYGQDLDAPYYDVSPPAINVHSVSFLKA